MNATFRTAAALAALFLFGCDAPPDSVIIHPAIPLGTGREIYTAKCIACHQPDGRGIPGICPPLADSPRLRESPEDLVRILLLGMKGPLTRDGVTYNGIMPAWRYDLSDKQIASVCNEIVSTFQGTLPPITEEMVKTLRSKTEAQPLFISPSDLEKPRKF